MELYHSTATGNVILAKQKTTKFANTSITPMRLSPSHRRFAGVVPTGSRQNYDCENRSSMMAIICAGVKSSGRGRQCAAYLRTARLPINVPFSSLSRFLSLCKFSQAFLVAPYSRLGKVAGTDFPSWIVGVAGTIPIRSAVQQRCIDDGAQLRRSQCERWTEGF